VAVGATVIGVAADAVEQVVRPDVGQTIINLAGTGLQEAVNNNPVGKVVAPFTNEIVEAWKQSGSSQSIQDWVNQQVKKIGGTQ
jgi:hypothetical protein